MPVSAAPSRRRVFLLIAVSALIAIVFVSSFRGSSSAPNQPYEVARGAALPAHHVPVDTGTLSGGAIMPKLGNETAKAELGRAAWKLFHTIMARFPDEPSADERTALQSYVHLFVRLYPCGECAEHFRQIVEKFPPQVSSRSAAAVWACHVHNQVNTSLKKEEFDCSKIGDFYDCGCAEDEKEAMGAKAMAGAEGARSVEKPEMSLERKEKITGANGREFNMDKLKEAMPLRVVEG